ncbi:hypothetical protein D3C86_1434010 [compost metagenome]
MVGLGAAQVVIERPAVLGLDEIAQRIQGHLGVQAEPLVDRHLLGQRINLFGVQLQQQADQQFLASDADAHFGPGLQARPQTRVDRLPCEPLGQLFEIGQRLLVDGALPLVLGAGLLQVPAGP